VRVEPHMTPYLDDGDVRLYHGDALEQLSLLGGHT
jgi:hypothetical protein